MIAQINGAYESFNALQLTFKRHFRQIAVSLPIHIVKSKFSGPFSIYFQSRWWERSINPNENRTHDLIFTIINSRGKLLKLDT